MVLVPPETAQGTDNPVFGWLGRIEAIPTRRGKLATTRVQYHLNKKNAQTDQFPKDAFEMIGV